MKVCLGKTHVKPRPSVTRMPDRQEFFAGVIGTAAEGGVQAWGDVIHYRWHSRYPDGEVDCSSVKRGAACTPDECPSHDRAHDAVLVARPFEESESFLVTVDHLAAAYGLVRRGLVDVGDMKDHLLSAYDECDAGELDAADAAALVEIAMFGQIVYC